MSIDLFAVFRLESKTKKPTYPLKHVTMINEMHHNNRPLYPYLSKYDRLNEFFQYPSRK